MIKEYKKILIMSVVLLILVICIVVVFTTDVSMAGIKSGSIFTISEGKNNLNSLLEKENEVKAEHQSALDSLEQAKNTYETEKKKFDNIDQATVDLVKEATKDEKYFIEYLWITLGNYATDNNLIIDVITPGSTLSSTGETLNGNASGSQGGSTGTNRPTTDTSSVANNSIRIIVKGRYANVADFVYDVENDKELKFRLDNMKMVYKSNNQIEATFNILSLQVKK
jgi:Tfp pilus assembly protein PilO